MMLRPEFTAPEPSRRLVSRSANALQKGRQARSRTECTQMDDLVTSLMPEGISANKRAVIEQVIRLWQAKTELDIA